MRGSFQLPTLQAIFRQHNQSTSASESSFDTFQFTRAFFSQQKRQDCRRGSSADSPSDEIRMFLSVNEPIVPGGRVFARRDALSSAPTSFQGEGDHSSALSRSQPMESPIPVPIQAAANVGQGQLRTSGCPTRIFNAKSTFFPPARADIPACVRRTL